jgi:hypothetical protein
MSDSPVPVLTHFLNVLSTLLKKAEGYCETRKIDPDALLQARLYPDMLPLTRQVMLVTDFAKGMGARLAGEAVPSYPDTEKTFADLQARIAKTIAFINSVDAAKYKDSADRPVTLKISGEERTFKGSEYLASFALPNFYFHLTTAYNILRHNGLEIGKGDYMGRT